MIALLISKHDIQPNFLGRNMTPQVTYDNSGHIWGQIFNIATSSLNISQNEARYPKLSKTFFVVIQGYQGLEYWKRSKKVKIPSETKVVKFYLKIKLLASNFEKFSFEVIQGHPRSEILLYIDENRWLE